MQLLRTKDPNRTELSHEIATCLDITDITSLSVCYMYDGWFVSPSRPRLQICNNGGTTADTSGLAKCEAVLHGCGTSPVFVDVYVLVTSKVSPGRDRLVTMCTHSDFIVLPHWDIRPPAP